MLIHEPIWFFSVNLEFLPMRNFYQCPKNHVRLYPVLSMLFLIYLHNFYIKYLMPNFQTLTMVTWNQVSWKDPRLGWNPEDNENLQVVRFHKDQIWIPDITNFHSVDEVKNIGPEPNLVTVMPDGSVFLAPMERLTVSPLISYL